MDTILFLPVVISLTVVSLASYTDLKKRIIPNRLTYPIIISGVVFYAVLGFLRQDVFLAVSGILGASMAFAIGYVLWVTHGWAGGDDRLMKPKNTLSWFEALVAVGVLISVGCVLIANPNQPKTDNIAPPSANPTSSNLAFIGALSIGVVLWAAMLAYAKFELKLKIGVYNAALFLAMVVAMASIITGFLEVA